MTKTKNKNNIFQFIIALAAGCLVFAVMQGIFIIAYKEEDENEEEQAGQPDESDRKKYD